MASISSKITREKQATIENELYRRGLLNPVAQRRKLLEAQFGEINIGNPNPMELTQHDPFYLRANMNRMKKL